MDDSYGMAYYVKGAAIGQLAQMAGIIQSMFLISDFDKSIDKAMELMPDSPFPFIAKGMRIVIHPGRTEITGSRKSGS